MLDAKGGFGDGHDHRVVAVVAQERGADESGPDVGEAYVDVLDVSEVVEGVDVSLLEFLGCAVGCCYSDGFCSGDGCDGGYLSGVDVGCVAEVFVGVCEDASESDDVDVEGVCGLGVVELGVGETDSGGEEEYVHSVDIFDEVAEASEGVFGGYVEVGCPDVSGILLFECVHAPEATCGHAYAPSHCCEIGGYLESDA